LLPILLLKYGKPPVEVDLGVFRHPAAMWSLTYIKEGKEGEDWR